MQETIIIKRDGVYNPTIRAYNPLRVRAANQTVPNVSEIILATKKRNGVSINDAIKLRPGSVLLTTLVTVAVCDKPLNINLRQSFLGQIFTYSLI